MSYYNYNELDDTQIKQKREELIGRLSTFLEERVSYEESGSIKHESDLFGIFDEIIKLKFESDHHGLSTKFRFMIHNNHRNQDIMPIYNIPHFSGDEEWTVERLFQILMFVEDMITVLDVKKNHIQNMIQERLGK